VVAAEFDPHVVGHKEEDVGTAGGLGRGGESSGGRGLPMKSAGDACGYRAADDRSEKRASGDWFHRGNSVKCRRR
jgi:hypothetical protein